MEKKKFGSFAILDFETSNLPSERGNTVGLTELCVYGIATNEFKSLEENEDLTKPQKLPRVLHKLTLMINPGMQIDTVPEKLTGLNNCMLKDETQFNENAARTLIGFLEHLKQPVCLVAHNGYSFDFPILKYVLERVSCEMPENIYVLDSLVVFYVIDELRKKERIELKVEVETPIDACAENETTSMQETVVVVENGASSRKRVRKSDINNCASKKSRTRLSLNFSYTRPMQTCSTICKKWFPPKGRYTLENKFKATFPNYSVQSHYAEVDVQSLTQLMLQYGLDFVDCSEVHAIPFVKIPTLGFRNFICHCMFGNYFY